MLSILIVIVSCHHCNPVDPPPPTCDPGAAYNFHIANFNERFSLPVSVTQITNGFKTTAQVVVLTSSPELFTEFQSAVNQWWNKTVTNCGKSYQISIILERTIFDFQANVEFMKKFAMPPGSSGATDDCGTWGPALGEVFATRIKVWVDTACNTTKTMAHEFGHELGFVNAYAEGSNIPLHTQIGDLMTAFGNSVFGAHGQVLAEVYGN